MSGKRRNMARVVAPTLAAVVVGTVAVAASVTEKSQPEDRTPVITNQAAQGTTPTEVGDPDNPKMWHLPIEAYMLTKSNKRLIGGVRDRLIDDCMADEGFPDWVPAPDLPQLGGKTLVDWRYGIHDAELAAKRGYHPSEEEQKAYDAAESVGAVDESGADSQTLSKCVAKADGTAPQTGGSLLVQQINGNSYKKSLGQPAVKHSFDKWSKCMAEKGYSYEEPMDANDDPAFATREKITHAEIATALADIECRKENKVAKTWFDAETKIQQNAIKAKQKELNKVKKQNKEVSAKAATVADK